MRSPRQKLCLTSYYGALALVVFFAQVGCLGWQSQQGSADGAGSFSDALPEIALSELAVPGLSQTKSDGIPFFCSNGLGGKSGASSSSQLTGSVSLASGPGDFAYLFNNERFVLKGMKTEKSLGPVLRVLPWRGVGFDSGSWILSIHAGGVAVLWDLTRSKPYVVGEIRASTGSAVPAASSWALASASPDFALFAAVNGRTVSVSSLSLVSTQGDGSSALVDYAVSKELPSRISSVEFDQLEPTLLLGGVDGRVYRWNLCPRSQRVEVGVANPGGVERYVGHGNVVSAVVGHPSGAIFFSADWSGQVRVWLNYGADKFGGAYDKALFGTRLFTDQTPVRFATSLPEAVDQLAVSADGQWLVVGYQTGQVELWQVRGFVKKAVVAAHSSAVVALAVGAKGERVVSVGRDGAVKVWNREQLVQALQGAVEYRLNLGGEYKLPGANSLTFASKDRVAVGVGDGTVVLLDLEPLTGSAAVGVQQQQSTDSQQPAAELPGSELVPDPGLGAGVEW